MCDIIDFKTRKLIEPPITIDTSKWINGTFDLELKIQLAYRFVNSFKLFRLTDHFSTTYSEPYSFFYDDITNANINRYSFPFPIPQDVDLTTKVIGLSCDPLAFLDRKYKTTLNFLRQTKNVTIHTKSDLCIHEDYLQVIKNNGHKVIIYSDILENEEKIKLKEPSNPSLSRRNKAYNKLVENGVDATLILGVK